MLYCACMRARALFAASVYPWKQDPHTHTRAHTHTCAHAHAHTVADVQPEAQNLTDREMEKQRKRKRQTCTRAQNKRDLALCSTRTCMRHRYTYSTDWRRIRLKSTLRSCSICAWMVWKAAGHVCFVAWATAVHPCCPWFPVIFRQTCGKSEFIWLLRGRCAFGMRMCASMASIFRECHVMFALFMSMDSLLDR